MQSGTTHTQSLDLKWQLLWHFYTHTVYRKLKKKEDRFKKLEARFCP